VPLFVQKSAYDLDASGKGSGASGNPQPLSKIAKIVDGA
jgi:hypothetical protein